MLYERDGAVATLTLNRPERLNAIVPELIDDLEAALDRAEEDAEVRVIRLAGAGRAFCAGYDIEWGARAMEEAGEPWDPIADHRMMSRYVRAYMRLWRSPCPVIAQVHGFCVGGGTDLALCSDLIVIAEDARLGYPPARVWGSPTTAMWIYRLGAERAKRLLLTGDPLDGRRAVEWGLASECAPAAELDAAARQLAARVAQLPANQLTMMKLLVNQAYDQMGLPVTQLVGHAARRRRPPHARGRGVHARRDGGRPRRGGGARRPVRRLRPGAPVRRLAAGLVLALVLAGCGDQGPTDEEQVRTTLSDFSKATAAKDYQRLCDKILAPSLIADLKKIGLPCEIALQQGLGDVKQPRLIVGAVKVKGKTATAEVKSSAEGEPPSSDTIELEHTDAGWQIASLASPSEPGPAP